MDITEEFENILCEIEDFSESDLDDDVTPESPPVNEIELSKEDTETEHFNIEQISKGLDEEEKRLNELEQRRQNLDEEITKLQEELEKEKIAFRESIDQEINRQKEILSMHKASGDGNFCSYQIDPLTVTKENIQLKLRDYQPIVKNLQMLPTDYENDDDITRLKSNLAIYKNTLKETSKDSILKQKKKVAGKIFQKHLEEIDVKCSEQMQKISHIQKTFEPGLTNQNLSIEEKPNMDNPEEVFLSEQ